MSITYGTFTDEYGNVGLIGPQGPEGPTGPQGPQGSTGPTGLTGAIGPQGLQGPRGDQGVSVTGPQGVQGPQGIQGPKGDNANFSEYVTSTAITSDDWVLWASDNTFVEYKIKYSDFLAISQGSVQGNAVQQANTYTDQAIANLVDGSPQQLDTLGEIANALNDDADVATTLTNSIATKLAIADFDSSFDTRLATKTTDNVTEGSSLYYTEARVDANIASKSTDNIAEGSNLYFTTQRSYDAFDQRLNVKTTSDLTEGSNLYFTNARADSAFDTRLAIKTTDDLTEGSVNFYYTDAKVDTRISAKSVGYLNDVNVSNVQIGQVLKWNGSVWENSTDQTNADTDSLPEGTNNKYYTDERVDDRLSNLLVAGANITFNYDDANNQLTISANSASGYDLTNNDLSDIGDVSITSPSNGQVLKYNGSNWINAGDEETLSNNTTTDLAEGNNLYYTDTRVNSAIDTRVDKAFVDALNVDADTLDGLDSSQFTRKDVTNTQTGSIYMQDSLLGLNNSSAPKQWSLINNSAGDLILHTGTSGIAEFVFENRAVNSSSGSKLKINSLEVLTTASILDQDDMSSNSSNRVPSQQSVKAYVDANVKDGSYDSSVKTSNFNISAGDQWSGYLIDTATTTVTVTLPTTPNNMQKVRFLDVGGNLSSNSFIINPNGNSIQGGSGNLNVSLNNAAFELMYVNSYGWFLTTK